MRAFAGQVESLSGVSNKLRSWLQSQGCPYRSYMPYTTYLTYKLTLSLLAHKACLCTTPQTPVAAENLYSPAVTLPNFLEQHLPAEARFVWMYPH